MQEIAQSKWFFNFRVIGIHERKAHEIAGNLKSSQAFVKNLCCLNYEKRVKNQTKAWKVIEK